MSTQETVLSAINIPFEFDVPMLYRVSSDVPGASNRESIEKDELEIASMALNRDDIPVLIDISKCVQSFENLVPFEIAHRLDAEMLRRQWTTFYNPSRGSYIPFSSQGITLTG